MTVDGIGRDKIVTIEMLRHLRAARAAEGGAAASARPVQEPTRPAKGADETAAPAGAGTRRPAAAQGGRTNRRTTSSGREAGASPERSALLEQYEQETRGLPDVRSDKVIEAKLRLSTGYYDSENVRREILRAVLADLLARGEVGPAGADAPKRAETGDPGDAPDPAAS